MGAKFHIKAVIFDLGGVILRTEDARPREALAERLGKTRAQIEAAVFDNPLALEAERGAVTPDMAWAETARRLGLAQNEIPPFREAFFAGDRVDFALVDFIQKLRPAFSTALLSNTAQADLPRFLREHLHMPDTFDVVISSAAYKVRKPDAQIFRIALDQIGARPEEAVFVDDFFHNIEAAAALGLHTVHFQGALAAMQALRALLHLPEA